MEVPSFSAGSRSRMALMPRGIMPMPTPCRPRPTIIGTTDAASAQTAEPMTRAPEQTSIIRRFP